MKNILLATAALAAAITLTPTAVPLPHCWPCNKPTIIAAVPGSGGHPIPPGKPDPNEVPIPNPHSPKPPTLRS